MRKNQRKNPKVRWNVSLCKGNGSRFNFNHKKATLSDRTACIPKKKKFFCTVVISGFLISFIV